MCFNVVLGTFVRRAKILTSPLYPSEKYTGYTTADSTTVGLMMGQRIHKDKHASN
jgi:hypothetical protein